MDENHEIILVTSYTPTTEKIDSLRELIKKIKSSGYKVCLATHTSTPQDIIDRCDYFIFDSSNELNHDRDISYWTIFNAYLHDGSLHFTMRYKTYNTMSTHIIPILNMVVGGLSYLKSLGYKKAFMLEYDSIIKDSDIFKMISSDLDNFEISAFSSDNLGNKGIYAFGPLIGINLQKIDLSKLPISSNDIIETYREYFNRGIFPVTERILFEKAWSHNSIKWNDIELLNSNIICDLSNLHGEYNKKNTYIFHSYNNVLHFFCDNRSTEDWNFDLIIDESNRNIIVKSNSWLWIPIVEIEKVNKIKVFIDNKFDYEMILSNENKNEYINQWVIFEPNF